MLKNLNNDGIFLKTMFDGYDFLQTQVGRQILKNCNIEYIISSTYTKLYKDADSFIDYCMCYKGETYIPKELISKYKCGLYKLSQASDPNNPWNNKPYVLFSPHKINRIKECVSIDDLEFYVCPSFHNGKVDGIGFRIKYPEKVNNAFKWLFMEGNNIIYGKDDVRNEPCYVVEGFRDYIALKECGYNVIGLGSVFISPKQKEYLDTIDPIILLDTDSFGLSQTLNFSKQYKIATLTGTKEKDAYDTWIKQGNIQITEIQ